MDIDSDISATTRGKVIEYVKNKYGENAVCGIMTMTTQAPKGSINIAAKFYGLKIYNQPLTTLGRTIAKDVPSDPGVSFASKVNKSSGALDDEGIALYDYLLEKYADDKDAVTIIKWAKIVEGSFTAYGSHAAGIVISDNDDVSEYLPLRYSSKTNMFTTQCNMGQVEDNGLLKFDFLGLKTLDIITESIRMIEENHGLIIDPLKIDINDSKVYREIFASGKTNSVFQFESTGMKAMLKRFKPECFEDLIILNSMFRPGPLQYLDGVIDVKNGVKPIEYLTPELEPILGTTYGAIVYQEQVMQICRDLAGFTLGHADEVRRYMSKKKADKLAHERDSFVDGCKANGIDPEKANTLFDQMMDFASYAFNKSHATAYSFNAYITAWLKLYYPAEFFASALNWATPKKVPGLMFEAKKFGIEIKAPDVNVSMRLYNAKDGVINIGLSNIQGIKNHANAIIAERENGAYRSFSDFVLRVNPNKTVLLNLISAGAFDAFNTSRTGMKKAAEEIKEYPAKIRKKQMFIEQASKVLPYIERLSIEEIVKMQGDNVEVSEPTTVAKLTKRIETAKDALSKLERDASLVRVKNLEDDKTERMNLEKELLGTYVTAHPTDFYAKSEELGCTDISEADQDTRKIYGVITNLQIKKKKADGKEMAFFTLEDASGSMEVAVFTKAYASYKNVIKEGNVCVFDGSCQVEVTRVTVDGIEEVNEETKFYANTVSLLTPKKASVMIQVPSYEEFKTRFEAEFKNSYEDEEGISLYILNKETDKIMLAPYKVSEKIKSLKIAKEIFI